MFLKGGNFIELQAAKEKFLVKCNAENLSLKTIQAYEHNLNTFIKFAYKLNIHNVNYVDSDLITAYLVSLKGKYQPVTVKDKFVALKIFLNYLTRVNVVTENPAELIKMPKIPERIIYSFNKQEVHEILSTFDKSTFIGFRNYTIMSVLFSTGIRKAELLNLTLFDISKETDTLRIIGKGNKERLIPISPALLRVLRQYIKRRTDYLNNHGKGNIPELFISKDSRRLSPGGLNTVFRHLKATKTRWSTRVSPHTWRHTFAKFYLLNGGDIFSLQKILGHEDISTTKIYIDFLETELKAQNNKFNPLDNTRWLYY